MRSIFQRLFPSPISRLAAVLLFALIFTVPALCGPIHDAAKAGDLVKVQALLKDNPQLVFSKDDNDDTPLHVAAGSGHKDVAELLLAKGADVNAKGFAGQTSLHMAAANDRKDVAELLLAKGADVNAMDNSGDTPLHIAALAGNKNIVELLLAHGADVNAKNNSGKTPLKWAVISDNNDVAELLRQHGGHE